MRFGIPNQRIFGISVCVHFFDGADGAGSNSAIKNKCDLSQAINIGSCMTFVRLHHFTVSCCLSLQMKWPKTKKKLLRQ